MESGESNRVSLEDILERVERQGESLKRELSELKTEVRGSAQAVKKLKSDSQIKWKYEGNKLQHNFNSDLLEDLQQVSWALQNSKIHYVDELVSGLKEKINKRNKLIKIADSSEAGWETVRQYETNPVASDSDDESKIFKAETRAIRKRKAKSKPQQKKPRTSTESTDSMHTFRSHNQQSGFPQSFLGPQSWFTGAPAFHTIGQQYGNFGGSFKPRGACFGCGSQSHWRNQCPYNSKTSGSKQKAE